MGQRSRRKKFVTRQSLREDGESPFWGSLGLVNHRLTNRSYSGLLGFGLFRPFDATERESADKPGSVEGNHSSGMHVTVHLERPTRKRARAARCGFRRVFPYLALLPAGFSVPSPLPSTRCALTAPFHPYRRACARLGGVFSVALSVGSRPPGVTWRRAMRSPDFPPPSCENGDCLADSRDQHRASRPRSQAVFSGGSFASASARA